MAWVFFCTVAALWIDGAGAAVCLGALPLQDDVSLMQTRVQVKLPKLSKIEEEHTNLWINDSPDNEGDLPEAHRTTTGNTIRCFSKGDDVIRTYGAPPHGYEHNGPACMKEPKPMEAHWVHTSTGNTLRCWSKGDDVIRTYGAPPHGEGYKYNGPACMKEPEPMEAKLPTRPSPTGVLLDKHGCNIPVGEKWCVEAQRCVMWRLWPDCDKNSGHHTATPHSTASNTSTRKIRGTKANEGKQTTEADTPPSSTIPVSTPSEVDARNQQLANQQAAPQAGRKLANPFLMARMKRKWRNICKNKVKRANHDLGQQAIWTAGVDPMFRPNVHSICSSKKDSIVDTANLKLKPGENPCDSFNHWSTFQDLANKMGRPYSVIGNGIHFSDIGQGALGSCYFLAAVAAIANTHKYILDEMFVERHLWNDNIFKTKWLVNGKKSIISIDNMIPAHPEGTEDAGTPFFAQPSATGEWWPVILSKAFAKIFGSFGAIGSGGVAGEALSAMTRAPIVNYAHQSDPWRAACDENLVWAKMIEATSKAFPMVGGTNTNAAKYGLAAPHAYAVLAALWCPKETGQSGKKCVKLFNPWRADYYNGKVPNTRKVNGPHNDMGVFTMMFHEYIDAFDFTEINLVRKDYKAVHKRIRLNQKGIYDKGRSLEIELPKAGTFYASITWPGYRMVKPCGTPNPRLDMIVVSSRKDVVHSNSKMFPVELTNYNSLTASVHNPDGGLYEIYAATAFEKLESYIEEVYITLYVPKGTKRPVPSAIDAGDLALELLGPTVDEVPCKAVRMETGFTDDVFILHQDKRSPTGSGVPTYWTMDEKYFLYYPGGATTQWYASDAPSFDKLLQEPDTLWSISTLDKSQLICGCNGDSRCPKEETRAAREEAEEKKRAELRQHYEGQEADEDANSGGLKPVPTWPTAAELNEPQDAEENDERNDDDDKDDGDKNEEKLPPQGPAEPQEVEEAECVVGDLVKAEWGVSLLADPLEAQWDLQQHYSATIAAMSVDGTITVDWEDGDTEHRILPHDKVFLNDAPCRALARTGPRWQTIDKVIRTCGGTGNGAPCLFPFKGDNGVTYTACTTEGHTEPYCATSYAPGTKQVVDWGHCDCTHEEYEASTHEEHHPETTHEEHHEEHHDETPHEETTHEESIGGGNHEATTQEETKHVDTCGGTGKGAPCLFPFTGDDGVLYTSCTTEGHSEPWCATSYAPGTTQVSDWGHCDCTHEEREESTHEEHHQEAPHEEHHDETAHEETTHEESIGSSHHEETTHEETKHIDTCGGTGKGAPCLFPFTGDDGVSYTSCTTEGHSELWCATSYAPGTTQVVHWGHCDCTHQEHEESTQEEHHQETTHTEHHEEHRDEASHEENSHEGRTHEERHQETTQEEPYDGTPHEETTHEESSGGNHHEETTHEEYHQETTHEEPEAETQVEHAEEDLGDAVHNAGGTHEEHHQETTQEERHDETPHEETTHEESSGGDHHEETTHEEHHQETTHEEPEAETRVEHAVEHLGDAVHNAEKTKKGDDYAAKTTKSVLDHMADFGNHMHKAAKSVVNGTVAAMHNMAQSWTNMFR